MKNALKTSTVIWRSEGNRIRERKTLEESTVARDEKGIRLWNYCNATGNSNANRTKFYRDEHISLKLSFYCF